ncbi:MAG: RidA family protein [Polaromonas sp.]|nr:RidA family protein [Polaromonas sp.]
MSAAALPQGASASSAGQPMASYAAARRAGDFVFVSGVVAVDPARMAVLQSYEELPGPALQALRGIGYVTGQMTVDIYEAPAVAQSWFVLERIRQIAQEHGGDMADVVKLVQYFRDLRHYPFYNRVRGLFYPGGAPVSTVVEVSRFMPGDGALIEVEATIYLPQ